MDDHRSLKSLVLSSTLYPQSPRVSSGHSLISDYSVGSDSHRPLVPAKPTSEVNISQPNHARWSLKTWATAYLPTTPWTISLAVILIIQSIVCISLQSYIFVSFFGSLSEVTHHEATPPPLATLIGQLVVLVFESVYQIVLALDAARLRNTIQIIGTCLNNFCILVFTILGWKLFHDAATALVAAGDSELKAFSTTNECFHGLFAVLFVGTMALAFVTWKLHREFAWAIYRHISAADVQLRKRYKFYQLYITLLHLDFFFLSGFWVQIVTATPIHRTLASSIVSILTLALTPTQLLLAGYSASREYLPGTVLAILTFLLDIGAVAFQLYEMYGSLRRHEYDMTKQRTTAYAIMAVPLLLGTIAMSCVVARNFGRGLRPHLRLSRVPPDSDREFDLVAKQGTDLPAYYRNSGRVQSMRSRMEID